MSAPVIVSSVRPRVAPEKLPQQPQRRAVWPFPSSDPAERDRMAREHLAQQRAAVVGGEQGRF